MYLRYLSTDDIMVVEIESEGIDLDKITKPYKEAVDMVYGSLKIYLLVGKAAEQFSYPTLTNSIRFGNTKNRFCPVRLIF